MDVLIRYGFSIEEIKNMMDTNDEIEGLSDSQILELINLLIAVGCHEEHIMNIFNCNPFFLNRNIEEIKKLIDKLREIGCIDLVSLFNNNPYILNLCDFDVDGIVLKRSKEGLNKEEIIDYFYYNTII